MDFSEKKIEQAVNKVVANLAMEGMHSTEEEKENMRAILRGEQSVDDVVAQYIAYYKKGE